MGKKKNGGFSPPLNIETSKESVIENTKNDSVKSENVDDEVTIEEAIIESRGEQLVTREEYEKEQKKEAPKEKIVRRMEKKKDRVPLEYELPRAPNGKCTIAIQYMQNGQSKSKELTLINKKYSIPEKFKKEEKLAWRSILLSEGFIDSTVVKSGSVKVENDTGKITYFAMHPDHHDIHNPIFGTIGLVMKDDTGKDLYDKDGKQISKQLTIKNGLVKTDDKEVFNAVIKAGFHELGKKRG